MDVSVSTHILVQQAVFKKHSGPAPARKRLHRKIVVIDNETAYTGSLNLVDPRFFKQDAGVGERVDAMVRITGPAVYLLSALFAWDWELETNSGPVALPEIKKQADDTQPGTADVQVIPSGPGIYGDRIYHLLMMTLYAARSELVITTPYFVPDEAIFNALVSAARRGVRVIIILPQKNDSRLVHYNGKYDAPRQPAALNLVVISIGSLKQFPTLILVRYKHF